MKIKIFVPFSLLVITFTAFVFCSNKKLTGEEELLVKIITVLKEHHYSPQQLNDEFSNKVYTNVLDKVDGDKRFFTAEDEKLLRKHKNQIDDQIKEGKYTFFDDVWRLMQQKLQLIELHYNPILAKKIDFTGNESIVIKDKVENYQLNNDALKNEWSKWVRFNVLDRYYRKIKTQKNLKIDSMPDSVKSKTKIYPMDTLELKARTETKKFFDDWFKRWRKMDRKDQISFYVNCITEVFDPHTNYFPPADKKNFDISMTGKLEGIGATLSERDGFIKIERIVPGSPSYKQGDLKAGDLIIKVAQAANEPVDVVDMKLDDAIKLIRGKKGTEVRLTVKKPDGSIKIIPIVRDEIIIEESYARSAIVETNAGKVGIIHLPSFYADFKAGRRGRHSAEDVSEEIIKLKEEGVQAIALDLRNNGGGSLQDAIEMSGLFIKSGPIVQVKMKDGKTQAYDDPDFGVAFEGPMVVLTNGYSASASEILAAALQDYKRAIIIGTKSTFGKGTVQNFERINGGESANFPDGLGEIKVTIQKFYRINGGTTQLRGVVPDVIVPDVYDFIDQGEKEMTYHLKYDQINKAKYTEITSNGDLFKTAVTNANKRISTSDFYNHVKNRALYTKKVRNSYTYSLNLAQYEKQLMQLEQEEKEFDNKGYKVKYSEVKPLQQDLTDAGNDAVKIAQKKDWLKMYAKDAMLEQALAILADLSQVKQ